MKTSKKRNIISDQTKSNLEAAMKIRITPRNQSALTDYYVVLVGKTGITAHVKDNKGETIIYKNISSAKRQLKNYIDTNKIEIVSQFDIDA